MAAHTDELLEQLRLLVERLPLPHPLWHRYVPEMLAVVVDARAALTALTDLPEAADELRRRVERETGYPDDDAGGPELAAARARLRALPVPEGEHPYLDEIRLALEAADAALSTLATVGAERAFVAALQRLPPRR